MIVLIILNMIVSKKRNRELNSGKCRERKRQATHEPCTKSCAQIEPHLGISRANIRKNVTHKAYAVKSFSEPMSITRCVTPKLCFDEVLIKNKFIGLNPIDWKSYKYKFGIYSFPWINGRESTGTVIAKGDGVANVDVGDDVFIASTSYRDLKTSTFQEFTVMKSKLLWNLKECKSLDSLQGATIGCGLITAGSAIMSLGIDFLNGETAPKGASILIWGGGGIVGNFLVQLARHVGFRQVIVVASSKHSKRLCAVGATQVIDRHEDLDDILHKIGFTVPEGLQYGVDTVGGETLRKLGRCLEMFNTTETKGIAVGIVSRSLGETPPDVIVKDVSIKRFHEDLDFGERFVQYTTKLFAKRVLTPINQIRIFGCGLSEGLDQGLQALESEGASGEKFVVKI